MRFGFVSCVKLDLSCIDATYEIGERSRRRADPWRFTGEEQVGPGLD